MTLPKVPPLPDAAGGDLRGPYGYGRRAHGSPPAATYAPVTPAERRDVDADAERDTEEPR